MDQNEVYKLVFHPNPALREKLTEEVQELTEEHKAIAEKMLRTMYKSKGCGLSAPQVGLKIRVIVYDAGTGPQVMFNPIIVNTMNGKKENSVEGCLSFPKLRVPVKRSTKIAVRYLSLEGKLCAAEFSDFEARVIQHEVDHLDGIVFLQRK